MGGLAGGGGGGMRTLCPCTLLSWGRTAVWLARTSLPPDFLHRHRVIAFI